MQIHDQTGFVSQQTMGMDAAGREYLSLVVKGSFDFPDAGSQPRRSAVQRPLVMADAFTGAPGFSATLWESDFAFRKPRCDVILQGHAHAPMGRPVERLRVGLRVGDWSKQIDVLGHREWRVVGPVIAATRPHPFLRQRIGYDRAFGGTDRLDPDDPAPAAYAANPVGTGFARLRNQSGLGGLALPATQMPGEEVRSPYETYTPAAFGPVGRGWPQRLRFGGTYDQHWQDEVFPFLPRDFDERYYQMAPEDQQIAPPAPGLGVILGNLTPRGREAFVLPQTELPITVFRGRETCFDAVVRPDTLLFDADARLLSLVWRIWVPMRRIITEFSQAWIGAPTAAMLRARRTGRRYIRAFAPGRAQL